MDDMLEYEAQSIDDDIYACQASIYKLKKDLQLEGLSDSGVYAIKNQISWNVGQIDYLLSCQDD